MSATCDRCLDGRHRCLTLDCACCGDRVAAPVKRAAAGGVVKAATRARPKRCPKPATPRPKGPPRIYDGDTRRERKTQHQRAVRNRQRAADALEEILDHWAASGLPTSAPILAAWPDRAAA